MGKAPALVMFDAPPRASRSGWAPFVGVRPLSELRAGVWRIRERWEAGLDLETAAVLSDHAPGFVEGDEPPSGTQLPASGPVLLARSTFAPLGTPVTLAPGTRRLTNAGETVAWLVDSPAAWSGPTDEGDAQEIDGFALRGTYDLVAALDRFLVTDCLAFGAGQSDPVPPASIVLGDPGLIFSRGATIEPGVVFDTRGGAIVIEAGAEVRNGARLEGPLYIGERARVLGGQVRFTVVGPRCNVRGEISNCSFLGYANKSHDGFVGHSVVGCWVNLGAGTTTSNLKNTYGQISLEVAGERISTGRQFLGSLIGDHAKTAIGTLLATGTVIGAGANVFGPAATPRYVPPMAWGSDGADRVTEEGFLKVAERVLPRRDIAFTPERRESLRATHRRLTG
ncbi:MAG TPA: putative sugar nucleotidyl transferase [Gemmatimonadales bacterium]|nr:putative sugar nucleotidyl transferase [Gemmatimonadales bacterium]